MNIATHPQSAVRSSTRTGIELVVVHERLWRVLSRDGRILGHVERVNTASGDTFIAKRFSPVRATFLSLGQFWNIQDAIDCLH